MIRVSLVDSYASTCCSTDLDCYLLENAIRCRYWPLLHPRRWSIFIKPESLINYEGGSPNVTQQLETCAPRSPWGGGAPIGGSRPILLYVLHFSTCMSGMDWKRPAWLQWSTLCRGKLKHCQEGREGGTQQLIVLIECVMRQSLYRSKQEEEDLCS